MCTEGPKLTPPGYTVYTVQQCIPLHLTTILYNGFLLLQAYQYWSKLMNIVWLNQIQIWTMWLQSFSSDLSQNCLWTMWSTRLHLWVQELDLCSLCQESWGKFGCSPVNASSKIPHKLDDADKTFFYSLGWIPQWIHFSLSLRCSLGRKCWGFVWLSIQMNGCPLSWV